MGYTQKYTTKTGKTAHRYVSGSKVKIKSIGGKKPKAVKKKGRVHYSYDPKGKIIKKEAAKKTTVSQTITKPVKATPITAVKQSLEPKKTLIKEDLITTQKEGLSTIRLDVYQRPIRQASTYQTVKTRYDPEGKPTKQVIETRARKGHFVYIHEPDKEAEKLYSFYKPVIPLPIGKPKPVPKGTIIKKVTKFDTSLSKPLTGFEKRIIGLTKREESLEKFKEKIGLPASATDITYSELRSPTKVLKAGGRLLFDIASIPIVVGGRIPLALELKYRSKYAKTSTERFKAKTELKLAQARVLPSIKQSFDPRKPIGLVNIGLTLVGVRGVKRGLRTKTAALKEQPLISGQKIITRRSVTPKRIVDISKIKGQIKMGKEAYKYTAEGTKIITPSRLDFKTFTTKTTIEGEIVKITKPKPSLPEGEIIKPQIITKVTVPKAVGRGTVLKTGVTREITFTKTLVKQLRQKPHTFRTIDVSRTVELSTLKGFKSYKTLSHRSIVKKPYTITPKDVKPSSVSAAISKEFLIKTLRTEKGSFVSRESLLKSVGFNFGGKKFITRFKQKFTIQPNKLPKTKFKFDKIYDIKSKTVFKTKLKEVKPAPISIILTETLKSTVKSLYVSKQKVSSSKLIKSSIVLIPKVAPTPIITIKPTLISTKFKDTSITKHITSKDILKPTKTLIKQTPETILRTSSITKITQEIKSSFKLAQIQITAQKQIPKMSQMQILKSGLIQQLQSKQKLQPIITPFNFIGFIKTPQIPIPKLPILPHIKFRDKNKFQKKRFTLTTTKQKKKYRPQFAAIGLTKIKFGKPSEFGIKSGFGFRGVV